MFERAKEKLQEYSQSLEQAQSLEGLMQVAADAEDFAVVTKNGPPFFVVMTAEQSRAVNGTSIHLDAVPEIKDSIKGMVNKALKTALAVHQQKLAPLEADSAKPRGFPETTGGATGVTIKGSPTT